MSISTKTCVDCGGRFHCPSTSRRTKRCDECKVKREKIRRSFTTRMRNEAYASLADKHGEHCQICRRTDLLVVDHIVPLVDGGTHDLSNLQLLCAHCNNRKYTRQVPSLQWVEE